MTVGPRFGDWTVGELPPWASRRDVRIESGKRRGRERPEGALAPGAVDRRWPRTCSIGIALAIWFDVSPTRQYLTMLSAMSASLQVGMPRA